MADWGKPAITDLYVDVLNYLAAKDSDSATLFINVPSNQPVGTIRYNRTTNTFQEWNGSVWQDKLISIAGGGTGANTPSGIVISLGLGTMSLQNATAVSITGGTAIGISSLQMTGSISFDTDGTRDIGTTAIRPNAIYVRNALVIPVGANKWAT
jgi:hypothetical protein